MILLNFYKIRTGIDIRPISQDGNNESQLRYEQLLQTIGRKAEIEYLKLQIQIKKERNPIDLKFYRNTSIVVYILIFGLNKNTSGWTASDLSQNFGNLQLTKKIKDQNINAIKWIGGKKANISCESALFDLRTKKKK